MIKMNDFTKEELEEIQEIARHCGKQSVETKHNLTYQVKCKVESMLDNYCEHQPVVMINSDGSCKCSACGRVLL